MASPGTCSANVFLTQPLVTTEEPADPQVNQSLPASNRSVRQPPLVAAVHTARDHPARRASRLRAHGLGPDPHGLPCHEDPLDRQASQMREQNAENFKIA
jgi:hypothetical protein